MKRDQSLTDSKLRESTPPAASNKVDKEGATRMHLAPKSARAQSVSLVMPLTFTLHAAVVQRVVIVAQEHRIHVNLATTNLMVSSVDQ